MSSEDVMSSLNGLRVVQEMVYGAGWRGEITFPLPSFDAAVADVTREMLEALVGRRLVACMRFRMEHRARPAMEREGSKAGRLNGWCVERAKGVASSLLDSKRCMCSVCRCSRQC